MQSFNVYHTAFESLLLRATMTALQPYWNAVAASVSTTFICSPGLSNSDQVQTPDPKSYVYAALFGNTASPAMRAVFDTMELAEMILGELCMRDLLINVQRTCKNWRLIIEESYKLQVALFFRPANKSRLVYRGRTAEEHVDMIWNSGITNSAAVSPSSPIYEHPIITRKCSKVRKYANSWYKGEAMDHPDASWRRQLATQPPLAELNYRRYEDGVEITGVIRASTTVGLTLGDFAKRRSLRCSKKHETWSWQTIGWDHAPAVWAIEPAVRASYTRGQWVAEDGRH
jgi:hypothetical protein